MLHARFSENHANTQKLPPFSSLGTLRVTVTWKTDRGLSAIPDTKRNCKTTEKLFRISVRRQHSFPRPHDPMGECRRPYIGLATISPKMTSRLRKAGQPSANHQPMQRW